MFQTLRLRNESGRFAEGVLLFFRVTRSELSGVRLLGGVRRAHPTSGTPFSGGLFIGWQGPPVFPGGQIQVELEGQGEPFHLLACEWRAVNRSRAEEGERFAQRIVAGPKHWLGDDPERAFERRRAAVAKTGDDRIRRFQEFFCEFDYKTHEQVRLPQPRFGDDSALGDLQGLTRSLKDRVVERARRLAKGKELTISALPAPRDSEQVARLSSFQLEIYRKHFGREWSSDVLRRIGEAFEMFANGELRVSGDGVYLNGEPNSANYFLFAEFAFAALELGIDEQAWSSLLNAFVRTQEIFTAVYRPQTTDRLYYSDYGSESFAADKQVSAETKREIRRRYGGLSVEALSHFAASNACAAFSADVHWTARPVPREPTRPEPGSRVGCRHESNRRV